MNIDNSYARLPARFYARVSPDSIAEPMLLAWNAALADELGLSGIATTDAERARIFSGSEIPDWAEPIALAYAGHQFGHFVPQLGDGRAVLLAEVRHPQNGRRFDIQLKGSGQTPFSRNGDGKSPLGPVIREYIVSEAMHALGVPTTRALAAVRTGEPVYRATRLPGAVFTRVAASHLRVGTFEYFAARNDVEALQLLTDYTIDRHYPSARDARSPRVDLFRQVVEAQAALVAQWMSIGFVHGVMNTDNTAISGETIDFGPCAFLDEFDYDKVFSSIDRGGRYAYSQQAPIMLWNLTRLGECLTRLGEDQAALRAQLQRFQALFEGHYLSHMRTKLGLTIDLPGDAELVNTWLQHLQDHGLDYTLSFRELATRLDAEGPPVFGAFETAWRQRIAKQQQPGTDTRRRMDAVNPLFIPRNHQIERAIRAAEEDDLSLFRALLQALRQPFTEQPALAHLAAAPTPSERVLQTFCGT